MLSRLLVLLMILGGATLATPAWAGKAAGLDAIVKPDPPGTWHKVTWNTASAPCIGNPITPICAIETVLWCFIVEDRELCNKVLTDPYKEGEPFDYPFVDKNEYFKYRILSVKKLVQADLLPKELNSSALSAGKVGDLEISLDRRDCYKSPRRQCPPRLPGEPAMAYTVRYVNGLWMIVNWAYPRAFKGSADYRK